MFRVFQGESSGQSQPEARISQGFVDHINKCLDCRACETACPSGVEYGKLVEHARARIERRHERSWIAQVARNFFFRDFLSASHFIEDAARVFRLYQRSGIQAVARGIGILKLVGLAERDRLLPQIDGDFFFNRFGSTFAPVGPRRARVAFFAGCIANVTFSRLNEATIRVLTANGCEVVVPKEQSCCGALSAHAGFRDAARGFARKNLEAFQLHDFDAIVTNAAGCGSTMKEYDHLFSTHELEHAQARAFAAKTRDVAEFLVDLGLTAKLGSLRLRVTYRIPATCCMDKKSGKHRANCCAGFPILILWNCRIRKSAAARREPTTSRKLKLHCNCSRRKCATLSPPAPKLSRPRTQAASCNSGPASPFITSTRTCFTLSNSSTGP